jgi:hypothetical protein
MQQAMVGHWALYWALNGHATVSRGTGAGRWFHPRSGLPRVLQRTEWTGIGMYMSRQVDVSLTAIVDRQIIGLCTLGPRFCERIALCRHQQGPNFDRPSVPQLLEMAVNEYAMRAPVHSATSGGRCSV